MKKVICLVLALALLCSLCACGKKKVEEHQKDSNVTAEKQPEKVTEKATEATTEPTAEENLVEFWSTIGGISCDVPEEYDRLENGYTAIAAGQNEFFASLCCGEESTYSGSVEDIFDFMVSDYTFDVNKYLYPEVKEDAWDLSYTDGASISGYGAAKISGTVTNLAGGTYEVYGYSTIIDDRPVIFLGILCSEEQAQEDMETMIALVEQMAGSIYK